jgi:hypothetical protein
VLNELEEIAQSKKYSAPIKVLFDQHNVKQTKQIVHPVPAVLSEAQARILQNGARNTVSLVIGPPGTEKSFTISALAMEHVSRGKSVLIASKMNHAVDVVGNMIEQKLGLPGCVVRGGRRQYLKELKAYIERLWSGMYTSEHVDKTAVQALKKNLAGTDRTIKSLERTTEDHSDRKIRWGRVMAGKEGGLVGALKKQYVRWMEPKLKPLWILLNDLESRLDRRIQLVASLIQAMNAYYVYDAVQFNREVFQTFLKGIRARTGIRQEAVFRDVKFNVLLKALPV